MPIKLIVGLGNPGDQYIDTRHNIGFKFINAILKKYASAKTIQFKSHVYSIQNETNTIRLIKPQTFMNLSGEAVQQVMQFYKITPAEICIVSDDLDVPFGRVRIRVKGGAGTHNGMKSIIKMIGTTDFLRLRLGIGAQPEFMDASAYVLQNFSSDEQAILPNMLSQIMSDFFTHIDQSTDILMNRLNPKLYK